MSNFVGTTAVAGIGATEFSKASGRSEMQLACEATILALEDAGIAPSEVDGMVTFTADTNPEIEIARLTGIGDLKFFSRIHHGGGAACGTVQQAAMAVATGVAEVVVCYRAFNERSGHRFGRGQGRRHQHGHRGSGRGQLDRRPRDGQGRGGAAMSVEDDRRAEEARKPMSRQAKRHQQ